MNKIISLKTARGAGLKRYFTGIPCKHGHTSERLVSTRACCQCAYLAVRKYSQENSDKVVDSVRRWRKNNPEKWRDMRKKRDSSSYVRAEKRLSSSIRKALKQSKCGRKWESIVGYTLGDLITHIERQFSNGMSWDRMDEWHIDHIVPKSTFDMSDEDDVRACWALSNLRPLWAADNMAKYNHRIYLI